MPMIQLIKFKNVFIARNAIVITCFISYIFHQLKDLPKSPKWSGIRPQLKTVKREPIHLNHLLAIYMIIAVTNHTGIFFPNHQVNDTSRL